MCGYGFTEGQDFNLLKIEKVQNEGGRKAMIKEGCNPMENSLQKVSNSVFGAMVCDYYSDGKGEFFMTRQQIGQALGYDEPNKRIDEIHSKRKTRLDKFSTTLKLRVVEGGREVNREMTLYSAKGVYEICRWSRQPKADDFYDHVYDILEGLRLGYLKLSYERQTPTWQVARIEGKKTRRLETDEIKLFVEYAEASGSKNAGQYYGNFTRLAHTAVGITAGERDTSTTSQLLDLRTIERVIGKAILHEISNRTEYHQAFQNVKVKVLQVAALALDSGLELPA